jgi:hypothetical protein
MLVSMRAALVLCVIASAHLAEEPRRRMTAAHERAMSHFDAGRFAQAAADLRAGYAEYHAPGLLYDEAVCHERLGDRGKAATLFARYIAEAGAPHDRDEVAQRVAALRLGMDGSPLEPKGVLVVRSVPPGARIYIGGRGGVPVGTTPWSGHLDSVQTLILDGNGFSDRYEVARPRPRSVTVLDVRF